MTTKKWQCGLEEYISKPPFDSVVHVCGEVGPHELHKCRKPDCDFEWRVTDDNTGTV